MSESNGTKLGARKGNANAVRHGLRCGTLPSGFRSITNSVSRLRQELESEIVERHGTTTTYQAALVQSCCRHEQRASLLQKWLRDEGAEMPVLDRASVLRDLSNATDARDKCLERLGLDKPMEHTTWATAFNVAPESPQTPQNASAAETAETSTAVDNAAHSESEAAA